MAPTDAAADAGASAGAGAVAGPGAAAGARARLRAGIAAGLAGALVASLLLGGACLVLVLLPPGVLVPVRSSRIALALFHVTLVTALAAAGGLLLGLALAVLPVRARLATALALAISATVLVPVAIVANVRHLPGLREAKSLAGNAGLGIAAVLLTLAVRRALRRRVPEAPRRLAPLAAALAVLLVPGVVVILRDDPVRALASGAAVSPWAAAPAGPARHTLVLVTIDALRADHLGCYGYGRATSPVIDALAASGTLYENAVAQAPNTHPSMASMLTGSSLVAFDDAAVRNFLPDGADTLAHEMKRRGYDTVAVVSNPFLSRKMGFAQGFDRFDDETAMVRPADAVTDAALRAAAGVEGPLFLWVHYLDPHHPYAPPPPHDSEFGAPLERVDAMQKLPDLSERLVAAGKGEIPFSEAEWARLCSLYDGEVRNADAAVGRLLDGLRAAGRLDDARVLVTADHGEEFRDHGGVLHAHTLYRELVHLPLVLWESGTATSATGKRDPRLLAATSVGTLLLGGIPEPAPLVLSEKLGESPGIGPPLVSLRSPACTLIVPAYRPDPFVLSTSRVLGSLRSLALFAPCACRRELYCDGDPAEARDSARERPYDVHALEFALGELYRAQGMRPGESDAGLPDERTKEQLQGLGYFR